MNKAKKMDSCRDLFKSMKILPLYSQYIFSLLMNVVNNKHLSTRNLEDHNHNTRSAKSFHLPITNLTIHQKVPIMYTGIKISNYLPTHIKNRIISSTNFNAHFNINMYVTLLSSTCFGP